MYREIITPATQEITLKIPASYLNKQVEILVFEVTEGMQPSNANNVSELGANDLSVQLALAQTIMVDNVDVLHKLAQ